MGGAPAIAHVYEAEIDKAIVGSFDGIEAVDCAGSFDGSAKGSVVTFGINPEGKLRRPLLYRAIKRSIGGFRSSWLDIDLRPTETP